MPIQPGQRLPQANLKLVTETGPRTVTTDELFAGKTVVLFALPGAFTPTCSAKHLPGFVARADELRAKGVDSVVCLSVNDAFVMDAWGRDQAVGDKVWLLADGNAEFTRALGLELDASGAGMGLRSQRYAMIVDDGVVRSLDIDPLKTFEHSSAEAVLARL
jgi:glutaredoxin/glutathione-dependent peroxiredoxin